MSGRPAGSVPDESRAALIATFGRVRERELDVEAARDELGACIRLALEDPDCTLRAIARELGISPSYALKLARRPGGQAH